MKLPVLWLMAVVGPLVGTATKGAEAPVASELLPAGRIQFIDADQTQVLDLYQDLSGRTILRSPALSTNRISLRNEKVATRSDALRLIEEALENAGTKLIPVGDPFQIAVPAGSTNEWASLSPPPASPPARPSSSPDPPPSSGTEVLPAGLLKFARADAQVVLEIWQELTGRTVLRPTTLPRGCVSVRSQTPLSRAQAIWLLETALRLASVEVITEGDRFAFALPPGRTNDWPRFDPAASEAKALTRFAPGTAWKLREVDEGQFSSAYASITRRRPAPLPGSTTPIRFSLTTQAPLNQAEAIYALETVAWANGFRFKMVGGDQFRLVPSEYSTPVGRTAFRNRTSFRGEPEIQAELEQKRSELGNDDPEVAALLLELGKFLSRRNAPAKAEPLFREALNILDKQWPNDLVNLEPSLLAIADALQAQGKTGELDQFLDGYLTPANVGRPGSSVLWRWRGNFRAGQGRWKDATADFRHALDGNAKDPANWSVLAPLLITQGDLDGYRAHRNLMLTRFRSVSDRSSAERVARAALFQPIDGDELNVVLELSRVAIDRGTNLSSSFAEGLARIVERQATNTTTNLVAATLTNGTPKGRSSFASRLAQITATAQPAATNSAIPPRAVRTYFNGRSTILHTAGLAEYRAGRITNALDRLEQARIASEGAPLALLDGERLFCLAMALHQNQQREAARAAFAQGVELVRTQLPKSENEDPGADWEQVLITRILMRDAQVLVEP